MITGFAETKSCFARYFDFATSFVLPTFEGGYNSSFRPLPQLERGHAVEYPESFAPESIISLSSGLFPRCLGRVLACTLDGHARWARSVPARLDIVLRKDSRTCN